MERRLSPYEVESLVERAQAGDNAAIDSVIRHFEQDIRKIAHSGRWYIPGADLEDIEQEARIGLYYAIEQYNPKRGNINFECFALKVCVKRAIITAINRENRRRMDPLNHGVSLSTPISTADGDSGQTLDETIPDSDYDLPSDVMSRHEFGALDAELKAELTELEAQCYELYKEGYTYREIAAELGEWEKTVDNALMRVRNKAKRVVATHLFRSSKDDHAGESLDGLVRSWGLNVDDERGDFWGDIMLAVASRQQDGEEDGSPVD